MLLSEPTTGVLELKLAGEVDMATVDPLRDAAKTAAGSADASGGARALAASTDAIADDISAWLARLNLPRK